MHADIAQFINELAEQYSNPPVYKSQAALDLEAQGWRVWYDTIFANEEKFNVDDLAPHHEQALEWHWKARLGLISKEEIEFYAYFSIWSRGHMKTTLARMMIVADACLSIGNGGSYTLVVGGTTNKVRGTAATLKTMLAEPILKLYYPELSEVKKDDRGNSKGWQADFINTKAGAVFQFVGLDQGVAGANVDGMRPTFIVPDDIDDREPSPVKAENRLNVFTTSILPTRQANTLVFFAQNLISRYGVMYRIWKQQVTALTNRFMTEPIKAIDGLKTERQTNKYGIIRDVIVEGTPTWKFYDLKRAQEEIDTYGLEAFKRECQHEVDETRDSAMLHNYNDDTHVISESEFAAVYGSLQTLQTWSKWNFNDWSRTKTHKHANVAGYITVASQNTAFPGATFVFHPMSFKANTEAEDVGERLLSVLSPFAYGLTTWEQLRKDELTRANAKLHTRTYEEETEFERKHLARIIPQYSRPLLEKWNVKGGVMSHSEDTIRQVYNQVFGFTFRPSNPGKFDALEDINRAMRIDFSVPHPFRPEQMGYTRWFIIVPDDTDDPNPREVAGRKVYRPMPFNDALKPDDLFDHDLLRYQLKYWRLRPTKETERGESDDEPLKENDDFGQAIQMVYHKKLLSNVELTPEEEFANRIARDKPHLTAASIEAETDPGLKSQKLAVLLREQEKFETEHNRSFESDDPFAEMFYEQNLGGEDLSWLENL